MDFTDTIPTNTMPLQGSCNGNCDQGRRPCQNPGSCRQNPKSARFVVWYYLITIFVLASAAAAVLL